MRPAARCAIAAATLLIFTASVAAAERATLEDARWLVGCWALEGAPEGSVEQWTAAAGGMMLGVSRTLREGRAASFEFMQIRATPEGSLQFVAHPQGQSGTTFGLIANRNRELVFENLAHDFPQRVSYRPLSPTRVQARIEGVVNGKLESTEYRLRRTTCAGDER